MTPELVVMAAGMGSRFGGLKQLETVGPNGETVMDYSLYDAHRAGVQRVIFVIRRELETAFRTKIGDKYERWLEVDYAYQELEFLPPGFSVPVGRTKPWGTAHAVLAASSKVQAPFLVINADDFYGASAFQALTTWLQKARSETAYAMVAFRLANTLSDHGSVARGICSVGSTHLLESVTEHTGLERDGAGALERGSQGEVHRFTGNEPVSMNFWGFHPSIFVELTTRFGDFLRTHGADPKAEFFLPGVVDALLSEGKATVQLLHTPDRWFGVTYQEDRAGVAARIQALIDQGMYPVDLWR
ncbi:MAG: NTP transferase domain-containing protein [Holophaga sp.]|nr:NTP transferase domain-containing protein [Holophaga sp.]